MYVCMHVCIYSFIHFLQLRAPSWSRNVYDFSFFPVIGCEVLLAGVFAGIPERTEEQQLPHWRTTAVIVYQPLHQVQEMRWIGRGAQSAVDEMCEQTADCNTVSKCHGSVCSGWAPWELCQGAVESKWSVGKQAGQWWLQGGSLGSGPQRMPGTIDWVGNVEKRCVVYLGHMFKTWGLEFRCLCLDSRWNKNRCIIWTCFIFYQKGFLRSFCIIRHRSEKKYWLSM